MPEIVLRYNYYLTSDLSTICLIGCVYKLHNVV